MTVSTAPGPHDCEACWNATLKDPRVPRRDHSIEMAICRGGMNVAAATTYANRCGITIQQILREHDYLPEREDS